MTSTKVPPKAKISRLKQKRENYDFNPTACTADLVYDNCSKFIRK